MFMRRWRFYLAIGFLSLLLAAAGTADAQTQRREDAQGNITYETGALAQDVKPYAKAHALIIGIGKYRHHGELPGAIADVKAVEAVLRRVGFDSVELRQNLEARDLDEVITRFFTLKGDDPNTLLLFWFAGHGVTVGGEGYFLPADAPKVDDPNVRVVGYPFWKLQGHLRQSKAHHVLAVFDSCFSGQFFKRQRRSAEEVPATVQYALQHPVRRVITAGDDKQRVDDDGTFRRLFVEALSNGVPEARDRRFVTGQELFEHLYKHVRLRTDDKQTPQTNFERNWTGQNGDVVFRVDPTAATVPAQRPIIASEASMASPRAAVSMTELLRRCRRQGDHPKAVDIVRTIASDLRGKTLTHTWKYGDRQQAAEQDKEMPHGLEDIYTDGGQIRFRMARRDSEVVLTPVLQRSSAGPTASEILFEGAWMQASGYGCVEFRYDPAKGEGVGRWWPQRWYSRVFRGRSVESELKVTVVRN